MMGKSESEQGTHSYVLLEKLNILKKFNELESDFKERKSVYTNPNILTSKNLSP